MLKKTVGRIAALCVMTLLPLSAAHAWGVVFDPTNFVKNTITAAEAVKSEVYQNTNLIYQYQMKKQEKKKKMQAIAKQTIRYRCHQKH